MTRSPLWRVAGAVLLGSCAAVAAGIAGAAPASAQVVARPRVVLMAVPGMVWADAEHMPHLSALADHSSVGELSVKTRLTETRCAAGMLAVSAGNRTTGGATSCVVDPSTWPLLRKDNQSSRFKADVGGLGSTLQANAVRTIAVGSTAVPMLADTAGRVDTVAPSLRSALSGAQAPTGAVIALLDQGLYDVPPQQRPAARTRVDNRIAAVEQQLPRDAVFMVAGISDLSAGHAQLHVMVIHGPGWAHTTMRSSAAGRAPYVQLIDIAPTILAAEHIREPSFMVGRPMQESGDPVPSFSSFVNDDRHAVDQRTLGQHVFLTIGIAAIVMMVLAATSWARARRAARWLARLVAPAPALVFLANAFPWWRWGQPAYGAIVLFGCIVLAIATALISRRNRVAGLVLVPVFTCVLLCADQLTGANLQLSAPLGDSPLVAGRFTGMGNLDFAAMATSALLVAGIVGGSLARLPGIAAAATICAVAVVVDGTPQLGNDIGGVLALVPASLVLVAMVAQVRFTTTRVVAVVVATLVVAVGLALADYARPATDQTHVGRFVGQVLHGGAGTEVHRKLDADLASFGLTVGTFVVVAVIVLGILTRERLRRALAATPGAQVAAVAGVVVAVLGVALNDSGITIAAMAAIVGVSAFYGGGLTVPAAREPTGPAAATAGATG